MTSQDAWRETAAGMIYEAYPDHDLLPIEPPKPDETIIAFSRRAEDAADTLFLFLCREADDDINVLEYLARLDRAIRDLECVRDALREDFDASAATRRADAQKSRPDVTIRLTLGTDWIELGLSYPDAQGLRAGTIRSSLRPSQASGRRDMASEAVESIVLAHACAGLDVTDPRYVEGIRRCVTRGADRR